MRVLWLSNRPFSRQEAVDSGTWLGALGRGLVASGEVELGNITMADGVSLGEGDTLVRRDDGPIRQWLAPPCTPGADGLPGGDLVAGIVRAAGEFVPDVVHIWGTEGYWGLLTSRGILRGPSMLDIQGLKGPCSRVYAGGLTPRERLACTGLREVVRHDAGISTIRRSYAAWSAFEREMIRGHRFITTQSPWVEAWVRAVNGSAGTFHTELALREAFYGAQPWTTQSSVTVFASSAYSAPFKGLHDAVRAVALLKRRVPRARLRIAGEEPRTTGIKRDGYAAWLRRLTHQLQVDDSIDWLGPLPASGVVAELQRCGAMLMPSHCESYGMAMAEALYLGVPVVAAHTGGSDWLARDEESAAFFIAGDEVMCARQLERVLADDELSSRLSAAARGAARPRHDPHAIVAGQLSRYRTVLGDG